MTRIYSSRIFLVTVFGLLFAILLVRVCNQKPLYPFLKNLELSAASFEYSGIQHRLVVVTDRNTYSKSLTKAIHQTALSSVQNRFTPYLKYFLLSWLIGILLACFIVLEIRRQMSLRLRRQYERWLQTSLPPSLFLLPPPTSDRQSSLPAPLAECLSSCLSQTEFVVISNREPYIHNYSEEGKIKIVRPASGLVTALEPILRHLGGLWIAHGSGSADQVTSDANGQVSVPPGNPKYTLKRVTLSQEEELGYYYGFANEGLWPLCHLAYNRPIFRLSDWEHYRNVNKRFTDAIPTQSLEQKSIILVQDYHFALVPNLIRKKIGNNQNQQQKIGLFWHIPWPNSETFGICPWGQELLHGMLGANVIGFHTQSHCNNFLESCNRFLEARIDWEHFSVTMDNHETYVRAFPIGIEPTPVKYLTESEIAEQKLRYGIQTEIVAVGVDRLDYTKGLIERVEGIERFLEKYPQYIGKFTFVQMGSPSRTHIPAYRFLTDELEKAIGRVNQRFQRGSIKPIIFLHQHYDWEQIQYFYQIGNLCLVTSLHDGMNLVAKEYIWCQQPEKGSLILSKFAGASRELTEAFIINPYCIEELADTIAMAISLPLEERRRRMLAMKEKVESHSAFHWAADLIRALQPKDESFVTQKLPSDHPNKSSLAEAS